MKKMLYLFMTFCSFAAFSATAPAVESGGGLLSSIESAADLKAIYEGACTFFAGNPTESDVSAIFAAAIAKSEKQEGDPRYGLHGRLTPVKTAVFDAVLYAALRSKNEAFFVQCAASDSHILSGIKDFITLAQGKPLPERYDTPRTLKMDEKSVSLLKFAAFLDDQESMFRLVGDGKVENTEDVTKFLIDKKRYKDALLIAAATNDLASVDCIKKEVPAINLAGIRYKSTRFFYSLEKSAYLLVPVEETLLHVAVKHKAGSVISYLCEQAPALIHVKNLENELPLDYALKEGDTESAKVLFEADYSDDEKKALASSVSGYVLKRTQVMKKFIADAEVFEDEISEMMCGGPCPTISDQEFLSEEYKQLVSEKLNLSEKQRLELDRFDQLGMLLREVGSKTSLLGQLKKKVTADDFTAFSSSPLTPQPLKPKLSDTPSVTPPPVHPERYNVRNPALAALTIAGALLVSKKVEFAIRFSKAKQKLRFKLKRSLTQKEKADLAKTVRKECVTEEQKKLINGFQYGLGGAGVIGLLYHYWPFISSYKDLLWKNE